MTTIFNSHHSHPGTPVPHLVTTVLGRITDWMSSVRQDVTGYLRPMNIDQIYRMYLTKAVDHADLERRINLLKDARNRWYEG